MSISARSSRQSFPIGILLLALLTSSVADAQGKGKKPPKDDPPPEPIPEVLYRFETMAIPQGVSFQPNQVHDNGLMVGWTENGTSYEALMYDHDGFFNNGIAPAVDTTYDPFYRLGNLLDGQLPEGWRLVSARGVNSQGDIVGTAWNASNERRGYVVDTSATAFSDPTAPSSSNPNDWTLRLLPDFNSPSTGGYHINDNGVVLGDFVDPNTSADDFYLYDAFQTSPTSVTLGLDVADSQLQFNNNNQVAGVLTDYRAFVLDAGDVNNPADEQLWISQEGAHVEFDNVTDFNDAGVFSGRARVQVDGKGATRRYAYRFSANGVFEPVIPEWERHPASRAYINDDNDVLAVHTINNLHFLDHTGSADAEIAPFQEYVDALLDSEDPLTDVWNNEHKAIYGLGERDPETGYPRIFAAIYDQDGQFEPIQTVLVPYSTAGSTAVTPIPEPASVWLLGNAVGSIFVAAGCRDLWTSRC